MGNKTFDDEYSCLQDMRDRDDAQAFKKIFLHYSERLFLFALKMIKDEDLAEEVVQEVFCKIWENRKNLDVELSFNSYIHTICKHEVFKMLKKAARHEHLRSGIIESLRYAHNDTEDAYAFREYQSIAARAIASLPPKRRLVYSICKIEGRSYEEAARELGISKNAVKDHMVKAGKSIREIFRLSTGISVSVLLVLRSFF